jgi:hypothetical protein
MISGKYINSPFPDKLTKKARLNLSAMFSQQGQGARKRKTRQDRRFPLE